MVNEIELRLHIRHLLLNYALQHLTVDYIAYTQKAVLDVLPDILVPVSAVDPIDPALQPSIYDATLRLFKQEAPVPYSEQFLAPPEALRYLKRCLAIERSTASSRCWYIDPEEKFRKLERHMSPILTKQSIHDTPKPGRKEAKSFDTSSHKELLNAFEIFPLDVPDIPRSYISAVPDTLKTHLTLDPDIRQPVLDIIKSIPGSSRISTSTYRNAWAQVFLRSNSPPAELPPPLSPPIFSRDRNPGRHLSDIRENAPFKLHKPEDLVKESFVSKVEVPDDGFDLDQAHLVIVNGWQAIETTSSPTPSLTSSGSGQVDELFLESSSSAPELVHLQKLLDAPMDEYEIARTEKAGGNGKRAKRLGEGESLAMFLSPAGIRPIPKNASRIVIGPQSSPSHTTVTASMLGQASTVNDEEVEIPAFSTFDGESSDDLAHILTDLRKAAKLGDPLDWIFNEKLDEKETMLMNVPKLPPPNEHPPNDTFLHSRLASMVKYAESKDVESTASLKKVVLARPEPFLKKVKGLQSLNIELSWRPFHYGNTIPTHEEIAKVLSKNLQQDFYTQMEMIPEAIDTACSILLDGVIAPEKQDPPSCPNATSSMAWSQEDLPVKLKKLKDDCDFILTAQELRHLNGHPEHLLDLPLHLEDSQDSSPCSEQDDLYEPAAKRIKLEPFHQLGASHNFTVGMPNAAFSAMENPDTLLDGIVQTGVERDNSTFARLSSSAESFDGPLEDENMFPDLEPILTESEYPSPVRRSSTQHPDSLYHLGTYDFINTRGKVDELHDLIPLPLDSTQCVQAYASEEHADQLIFTKPSEDPAPTPPERNNVASDYHLPDAELCRGHTNKRTILPVSQSKGPCYSRSQRVSARESLATFLAMRSKKIEETETPSLSEDMSLLPSVPTVKEALLVETAADWQIPTELIDRNTHSLPEPFFASTRVHTYMASMETMSRRGLVRALASETCFVNLVERESLDGVQLILDPDTAVLLVPLLSLPTFCQDLTGLVAELSWRYTHLLLLFEAFPSSRYNCREGETRTELNPFSPAVIKSVKKLRRDINLVEGMGSKRENTGVQYAFASAAEEAAKFVRTYGEFAEDRDTTGGSLWGERSWLEHVEDEESENHISNFPGLNRFIASIILTQVTFDELAAYSSAERMQIFGPLIGVERMENFNRVVERRVQFMELPSSSPAATSLDTTITDAGFAGLMYSS